MTTVGRPAGVDRPVEVFVRLPHSWCGASVAGILSVAAAAERLGFAGVSAQDHILSSHEVAPCGRNHAGDDRIIMDPLTTLAFVAATTQRVKLLTSVIVLPFHNVIRLAKTCATLDVLSNGRLVLGFGIGSPTTRVTDGVQNMIPHSDVAARETALFPLPGRRGALMDEALEALQRLWTEDAASFEGSMIQFHGVDERPMPAQRPRPVMLVGGRAKAALHRAGALADGWFPSQATVSDIRVGRRRVVEAAVAAGRPEPIFGVNLFAAVDSNGRKAREVVRDALRDRFRTEEGLFAGTVSGSPAEVTERLLDYADAGCSVFDLKLLPSAEDASLAQMQQLAADVLPALGTNEHRAAS